MSRQRIGGCLPTHSTQSMKRAQDTAGCYYSDMSDELYPKGVFAGLIPFSASLTRSWRLIWSYVR